MFWAEGPRSPVHGFDSEYGNISSTKSLRVSPMRAERVPVMMFMYLKPRRRCHRRHLTYRTPKRQNELDDNGVWSRPATGACVSRSSWTSILR